MEFKELPKPCKYCGSLTSNGSDEDCPDNPKVRLDNKIEEILGKIKPELVGLLMELLQTEEE